jgi:pimeloyl-ACP methyl ester carboxylesterase
LKSWSNFLRVSAIAVLLLRRCVHVTRGNPLESYEGDRFAESIRFVRSYKDELPVLRDLLQHIETPVQIITGDHDPGVLPVNGEYLHERLPHNKHDYLNAGHFAWADAADDYARLLIDWWDGGYERV